MGEQGDLWSGQADHDPHVHGDTNIHYLFVVIRTYTNGGGQLDHGPQYPLDIHALLQEQWDEQGVPLRGQGQGDPNPNQYSL